MMPIARRRPIIYNAHNFEPDYVRSPILGNHGLARAMRRRYERKLIGLAAETWMVSEVDVESARKLVPTAKVRYVPNVVDVAAILTRLADHDVHQRTAPPDGGQILMVGDFTYPPNRNGRELLVDSVLPLVWQSLPEARLKIAGREAEAWEASDPRIEVTGWVESLAGLYAQADCVVVPITEGAGSSFKFIEALAYGVPVVATPQAARGLGVAAGVHYLEGHDAATLAAGNRRGAARGRRRDRRRGAATGRTRTLDRVSGRADRRMTEHAARSSAWPSRSPHDSSGRWLARAAGTLLGRRYPFVLCYHGIGPAPAAGDPFRLFVSRELFSAAPRPDRGARIHVAHGGGAVAAHPGRLRRGAQRLGHFRRRPRQHRAARASRCCSNAGFPARCSSAAA